MFSKAVSGDPPSSTFAQVRPSEIIAELSACSAASIAGAEARPRHTPTVKGDAPLRLIELASTRTAAA